MSYYHHRKSEHRLAEKPHVRKASERNAIYLNAGAFRSVRCMRGVGGISEAEACHSFMEMGRFSETSENPETPSVIGK
jgi:hypothetical protein